MTDVTTFLAGHWPAVLQGQGVSLRPVAAKDLGLVEELLQDSQVRLFLGGPVGQDEIAARRDRYVGAAGCFAVVPAGESRAVGLVTIGRDSRQAGRAEISFQLAVSAWGHGHGRHAVAAAFNWWLEIADDEFGTVVAVTQEANAPSRRLLEAVGMSHTGTVVEHGARQCVYAHCGTPLLDLRVATDRAEASERRMGAALRNSAEGRLLPDDLEALDFDELALLCVDKHGRYGRICARADGHQADWHCGRKPDGAWIAWLGAAP
jgi:RimJ/RimL family protein N-acetyltransferase